MAQLWFSGKELIRGHQLKEFVGNNEKTKIIVKIAKRGSGAPPREPVMTDDDRKQLMMHAYKRQEELKVSAYILLSLLPTDHCREVLVCQQSIYEIQIVAEQSGNPLQKYRFGMNVIPRYMIWF